MEMFSSLPSPPVPSHQEAHIFGVLSPRYGRLRFRLMVDEAAFLQLTQGCGLPKLWCCWHQGTTPYWPTLVEQLPLVTVGLWQYLNTGQMPTPWTELHDQPQDPRPLLQSYRNYCWAVKGLRITPCTIREANTYVRDFHRHSKPVQGALFAVCATDAAGVVRGVAIVGRPKARMLDVGIDGRKKRRIAELVRLATDTTWNVSSLLYGAVRRITKEMGFEQVITYTLKDESGASLRAAGWTRVEEVGGHQWDSPSRPRDCEEIYDEMKYRWQCSLNDAFPFDTIYQPLNFGEAMPFACHHYVSLAQEKEALVTTG